MTLFTDRPIRLAHAAPLALRFKALGDQGRLLIMSILWSNGESGPSEIRNVMAEAGLTLTQPTVFHHLRILEDAGLVIRRQEEGKAPVFYRADVSSLSTLRASLESWRAKS